MIDDPIRTYRSCTLYSEEFPIVLDGLRALAREILAAANEQSARPSAQYRRQMVSAAGDALAEVDAVRVLLEQSPGGRPVPKIATFQERVADWVSSCFGETSGGNGKERAFRFVEEALELAQAAGVTPSDVVRLVNYVYARETGDPYQEVGGVLLTLAALCAAIGLDLDAAGEAELERVWTKIDAIRAKNATKPDPHGPEPGIAPATTDADPSGTATLTPEQMPAPGSTIAVRRADLRHAISLTTPSGRTTQTVGLVGDLHHTPTTVTSRVVSNGRPSDPWAEDLQDLRNTLARGQRVSSPVPFQITRTTLDRWVTALDTILKAVGGAQ